MFSKGHKKIVSKPGNGHILIRELRPKSMSRPLASIIELGTFKIKYSIGNLHASIVGLNVSVRICYYYDESCSAMGEGEKMSGRCVARVAV